MTWKLVFDAALDGILGFALVFGSYHFAKFYVAHERRYDECPAIKREKVAQFIYCFLVLLGLSFLIGCLSHNPVAVGFKVFFLTVFPSMIGMANGFERDAKMSQDERRRLRSAIEKSDDSNNNSYSNNVG